MEDAWISMEKSLATDPRVVALAERLKIPKAQALGCLYLLWVLVDEHIDEDNVLRAYNARILDAHVGCAGFCEALPEAWFQPAEGGILFPGYTEHNGTSARARAVERRRKRQERQAKQARTSGQKSNGNRTCVQEGLDRGGGIHRHRHRSSSEQGAQERPDDDTLSGQKGDNGGASPTTKIQDTLDRTDAMKKAGLGSASYLLEEYPDATPEAIRVAMSTVDPRASVKLRVTHFRNNIQWAMEELRRKAQSAEACNAWLGRVEEWSRELISADNSHDGTAGLSDRNLGVLRCELLDGLVKACPADKPNRARIAAWLATTEEHIRGLLFSRMRTTPTFVGKEWWRELPK